MAAAKDRILFSFLILMLSGLVESDIFYDVLNKEDPCEEICEKTYPRTIGDAKNVLYSACCHRGCRFFNLVHLVEEKRSDLNATKESCEASCMQAYAHTKDRYACNIGCATMAKQRQSDTIVSQITWAVYVEEGNSVLVIQPADFEPDDVLTDPGLRRQLERDFGLRGDDNRLPETHIQSLPGIDKYPDVDMKRVPRLNASDWLDCASRKSGLPRMLLLCIILSAVMLALWLCLSPERHNVKLVQTVNVDEALDLPPKYSLLNVEQV